MKKEQKYLFFYKFPLNTFRMFVSTRRLVPVLKKKPRSIYLVTGIFYNGL